MVYETIFIVLKRVAPLTLIVQKCKMDLIPVCDEIMAAIEQAKQDAS